MRKITVLLLSLTLTITHLSAQSSSNDFYDPSVVRDVRIEFKQKNWRDMLDSMRLINSDEMLVGKVTIDGASYDNVGIAYAKSPTYIMQGRRNPWTIKLNLVDKNKNHQGFKTLSISNALRDPSLVREVLAFEIARKYMPAPRANHVNLTVNNENFGIHVNIEDINDAFLEKNYATTEGVLLRCVPDFRNEITSKSGECEKTYGALKKTNDVRCLMSNFELKSKDGWDDLLKLTKVLTDEPQNISKTLNVDQALWYLAFNTVILNLNSYSGPISGNFYLYKDKNGLFNIIPNEMNLAFGSLKNISEGSSDLDMNSLSTLDPYLNSTNNNRPLVVQLLKNPDYKKIYMAHVRRILADWFENEAYKQRVTALQSTLVTAYMNDKTPPYAFAEFQKSVNETVGTVTKIPGIAEIMALRTKYLRKHPDMLIVPPVVSEVTVSNRKRFSNNTVTEFRVKAKVDKFPRRVVLYYRPVGTSESFIELVMHDDGKSHDAEAGDKIFGAVVNPMGKFDALEYYILAENAGAAAFDPPNYVSIKHKITLKELNQ